MSKHKPRHLWAPHASLLALFILGGQPLQAAAPEDTLAPKHKVVIQVSTDDPRTQQLALNNALNLQKDLGMDNVAIEVVAYGQGLTLYTSGSPETLRVPGLAQQNIVFSACGNTVQNLTQQRGQAPTLVQGVRVVPAGVSRIVELQEQGYSYIRP